MSILSYKMFASRGKVYCLCSGVNHRTTYNRTLQSLKKETNKIQTLLISNLSISDLLMGISLLILAISDMYYEELFPSYTHMWTKWLVCKVIGLLSIVSNEASVFLITLISIDRCFAIKYPFRGRHFTIKTAKVFVFVVWLISTLISAIAIGLTGTEGGIFSTSEVCTGIPIIRLKKTRIKTNYVWLNQTNFVSIFNWREVMNDIFHIQSLVNVTSDTQTYYQNVSYPTAEIIGSTHSPILSILIFIVVNSECFVIVVGNKHKR